MNHITLIAVGAVIGLISTISYQLPFLHDKKIHHITLIQYIYLIILPSVMFTIIFLFVLDISQRPVKPLTLLNSTFINICLFLSLIYTYAGIVIHGICKTISASFCPSQSKTPTYQINKHFHMVFSHNIIYSGAAYSAVFLALLELNHLPTANNPYFLLPLLFGLIFGFSFVASMVFNHASITPSQEYDEVTPWSSLKFFFYAFAIVFLLLILIGKPYQQDISSYPLALSMLTACLVVMGLSVFLYSRRLYRRTKHRFLGW